MTMNPQISFLDGSLRLIHISLQHYSVFLHSILQVLLAQEQSGSPGTRQAGDPPSTEGLTEDNQHIFLNISITPIECSIVCHNAWVKNVFEPAVRKASKEVARSVSISKDTYHALSVISAGMDAGSRVAELTSPLALAGIPIFFITTYYSDFILVPTKDRQSVVQALVSRGFQFSESESAFVSATPFTQHGRGTNNTSPPTTPPPSNVAELQSRTFDLLRKRNVVPYIEPDLHLIQCSGHDTSRGGGSGEYASHHHHHHQHRPSLSRTPTGGIGGADNRHSWVDSVDTRLYTCLIAALTRQPRFLSVTLAQDDAPSLLLDRTLLPVFGDSLVGDTEGDLVPLFLDLVNLPIEATGIVCGVAGRLVQDMCTNENAELSYLSTARAGAVILAAEQSVKALGILRPLLSKE